MECARKRSEAHARNLTLFSASSRITRSHGVMASTLDSESNNPSSNLGGTSFSFFIFSSFFTTFLQLLQIRKLRIYVKSSN